MLSPDIIQAIFVSNSGLSGPNQYHGHYNSLLLSAFPTVQFSLSLDHLDHDIDAMTLHLRTTRTTQKPVFILLIAPNNTSVTCKNAEATMLKLLAEADAPCIPVMHGMCVCGTQAVFYQYDRKRQNVFPKPQGQVHFDLDLATESGAVHFMEVAEEVQQMCREIIPDLEVPAFLDIEDP